MLLENPLLPDSLRNVIYFVVGRWEAEEGAREWMNA